MKIKDIIKNIIDEYGFHEEYLNRNTWRNKDRKLHREDGPAIEYLNGTKGWLINGKLHREDGPAIEYSNGYKSWYLDGNFHTEREFILKTSSLKEEEVHGGILDELDEQEEVEEKCECKDLEIEKA